MARRKSLLNIEQQRVRLTDEVSRQYRAAQNRYFSSGRNADDAQRLDALERRYTAINGAARRYDANIRRAVGIPSGMNSYYGDRNLIARPVSRRVYMGLSNG